mmetsp:Transcript_40603/g.100351  ORF Transcript_40603/g.100351 Transcript_40603/m.100351 type:complete len:209 (-) Transcript_40603:287-913(-)
MRQPRQPYARATAEARHVASRALLQPFGRPAADAVHRDDLALVGVAMEELERLESKSGLKIWSRVRRVREKPCSGAYTRKCGLQRALVSWDVLVVYEPCAVCQHAGSVSLVGGEAVVASTLLMFSWYSLTVAAGHRVVALPLRFALVGGEAIVASTLLVVLWYSLAVEAGCRVVVLRRSITLVGGESKVASSLGVTLRYARAIAVANT